jgi:hypothetical protein
VYHPNGEQLQQIQYLAGMFKGKLIFAQPNAVLYEKLYEKPHSSPLNIVCIAENKMFKEIIMNTFPPLNK